MILPLCKGRSVGCFGRYATEVRIESKIVGLGQPEVKQQIVLINADLESGLSRAHNLTKYSERQRKW